LIRSSDNSRNDGAALKFCLLVLIIEAFSFEISSSCDNMGAAIETSENTNSLAK